MANESKLNQKNEAVDIHHVLKARRDKLAELQAAGKDPFVITSYDQTQHSREIRDNYETFADKEVSVAGRLMLKRIMGKASFCHVSDRDGQIQVYVARDSVGEEAYAAFKKLDIGDLVGVKGKVFKTKTGEISVHAESVTLLAKSLQVLPEKFHGITDTDTRYRQRYVDLIINPEVKETFIRRSAIIREIRRYLDQQNFIEVETPILVENAGGASARPFETHFNALNEDKKLRISLELYLKRLIVGGLERVYEIGRVFRNEGTDAMHNPEFTLMELYQAYTDYHGMMDLAEGLYRHVAKTVCGTTLLHFRGQEIDLGKPFERITMLDAVKKYAGIDFSQVKTDEEAKAIAREKGVAFEERHKKGDILNLLFDEFVEDKLIQPTFVMDHPVEVSPLTKRKPDNPDYTERFELYINGGEFANAYSELNDPIDQRERFKAQEAQKAAGDEEANTTDEDFMNALEIGMPPTGGIGFGIDRMVMLMTDSPAIRDVLLFPTLRTLKNKKAGEQTEEDGSAAGAGQGSVFASSTSSAAAAGVGSAGAPLSGAKLDLSKVMIEPLFAEFVDFETFAKSDFRVVKVEACEAVPKSKKLLKFTLNDGTECKRTILSGIHEYYEPEELVGKTCVAITNLPPRKMMGIDSEGMLISAVYEYDGHEGLNLLMLDENIPAGAKLY